MRAAMRKPVKIDCKQGRMYRSERTMGVLPPRDIDELLDVANLLGLYGTCNELDSSCILCQGGRTMARNEFCLREWELSATGAVAVADGTV